MPDEEYGGGVTVDTAHVRGSLPKKRRVNLALVTKQRVRWERPLIAVLLAAVLCNRFVQYGVLGRFDALRDARQQLESVEEQFAEAQDILDSYYEARDTYVHITWSDMTAEEIGWVDPLDVSALLERVVFPVSPLDDWSLENNSVTLTVQAGTLEEINDMANRLRGDPMVAYCSVHGGGREVDKEDGAVTVTSQIELHFKDADNSKISSSGEKGADTEGADETASELLGDIEPLVGGESGG